MFPWFGRILKDKRGFTLVELMVVLVIIGIIGMIAVPRLTGYREAAAERACEANIKAIETAAMAHISQEGIPENGEEIEIDTLGDYLPDDVQCPLGGNYTISVDDDGAVSVDCNHDQ